MFPEHLAQGVFVDSAVESAQNLKSEAETIQPLSFKTSCQLPDESSLPPRMFLNLVSLMLGSLGSDCEFA